MEEKIEAYKQAIRINPDDADAHFNLGNAYGSSGMYKEEIEAYKQAIRIDPDFAYAPQNKILPTKTKEYKIIINIE